MPYIGNTPADKFLTLAKQSFSTSATTSYTLDSAVSSTQDIALFINSVRQSPVDAYSVSGTALTLTSATAGTDEMYCVYLGKTVGTVSPASDSVTTAMLQANAVSTAKIQADAINGTKIADDSISDEHLDITAITGQTAITSLADTDKFLVSDASDSGNLKYVEKQYLPSGTLVKLAQVDNSTSSSTVSDITLDHFSTTYDYYRFFATMGADTASSDWRVRFRDGGSDVTSAYYIYTATNGQINSGGTGSSSVGLSAFFTDRLDFANNSTTSSNQKVVLDWTFSTGTGNSANRLQLMGNTGYFRADDVSRVGTFRGFQNNQGSNFYEGFKIYLSSGNIRYYNYALYGVVK
jgi:hypothetical protein